MKLNHEERLLILNLLQYELLRLSSQIDDLNEEVWTTSGVDIDSRVESEIEAAKELRRKRLELEAVKRLKDKIDSSIQFWNTD
jgi:hypothetical protein